MAKGTVKWFNEKKGFGFIVDPEVPTDIFVHFSVIQADGFRTLNEGETVEYELYQDEKEEGSKWHWSWMKDLHGWRIINWG